MKNVKSILLTLVILFCEGGFLLKAQKPAILPYLNPGLSARERAGDLLGRMTIDEKTAQLLSISEDIYKPGFLDETSGAKRILRNGVGCIQPEYKNIRETVEYRNLIQKYLKENTRLGIPAIFVDEGCHGVLKPEATSFPMPIALSCSWDTLLFQKVFKVVSGEMRSRGAQLSLTPVIDISRDPRWGRVSETYGEDPYLSGILGAASVIGLQGSRSGMVEDNHVGSTLKHFAGHGQPENGINQGPASFPERTMREFHLLPFQMAIKQAKPVALMAAYVENDGVPCSINSWLLKSILRDEWNYKGIVVSDYFSIEQLWSASFYKSHYVATDATEAAKLAFNAGVDWDLPGGMNYRFIPGLVEEGKIKIADLDSAVYRTLKLKFELGLFENRYADEKKAVETSKLQSARDLALEAAHESVVMLKNEGNLLPLQKGKYNKIAVIGPFAKTVFMGSYSGDPYYRVSLFEGIKSKSGKDTEVLFAQGCKLTTNYDSTLSTIPNDIPFPDQAENQKHISEAFEVAKKADIIILAIGEHEQISREAFNAARGDAATLDLISSQDDLTKAMVATGKPVVVCLTNGRPLAINYAVENVSAIIETWFLGQETGNAIADILFGDVNPSGKLTMTFPKSVGQLPMYYNYKPTAHIDYVTMDSKPLFPFGFGLSFTKFEYGKPKLSQEKISIDCSCVLSVDVTNTGKMKGDEIVQLYIHDKISSVTRPVIELKGFRRISLDPGQTKTVRFTIDKQTLAFWDINMKYTVEPGGFDVMVGRSSVSLQTIGLKVE